MLLHCTELLVQSGSHSLASRPSSGGRINSESKIFVFVFSDSSLKFSFRGIPALFSISKLSFPGQRVPVLCCAGGLAWLGGVGAAVYQRESQISQCVNSLCLQRSSERGRRG